MLAVRRSETAMTHKKREEAAGLLLNARGAVSCFIPFGMEETLNENCILDGVRAGNIQNVMEKIDKVLELLGHEANGRCMKSSHRPAARMPGSQPGDASSSLAESIEAICPHCGDRIGPDDDVVTTAGVPISSGDFTVCLTCRETIRFNDQLQLRKLNCQDCWNLIENRDLFIGLLRWRMQILLDQLKEQELGHSVNGISSSW